MDLPKSSGLGKLEPVKRKRPTTLGRKAPVKKTAAAQTPAPAVKARPRPKVAAKKTARSPHKQPKFLCPDHHVDMVYSADLGYWACEVTGCTKTRKAQVGGDADTVTKIVGSPKVVCKYDKDGDPHYYLHYDEYNLTIELPYRDVVGHQVFGGRTMHPSVVVNLRVDDFVFLEEDGTTIPTPEVIDR